MYRFYFGVAGRTSCKCYVSNVRFNQVTISNTYFPEYNILYILIYRALIQNLKRWGVPQCSKFLRVSHKVNVETFLGVFFLLTSKGRGR